MIRDAVFSFRLPSRQALRLALGVLLRAKGSGRVAERNGSEHSVPSPETVAFLARERALPAKDKTKQRNPHPKQWPRSREVGKWIGGEIPGAYFHVRFFCG